VFILVIAWVIDARRGIFSEVTDIQGPPSSGEILGQEVQELSQVLNS
jgi:hypothetical protein